MKTIRLEIGKILDSKQIPKFEKLHAYLVKRKDKEFGTELLIRGNEEDIFIKPNGMIGYESFTENINWTNENYELIEEIKLELIF